MKLTFLLRVNPIVVKELRARMRGPRAFVTLTAALVIMAGVMYGTMRLMIAMSEYSYDMVSPRIGQSLFSVLAFLELLVVCAVTPAVTSGAISGERERRTYDLLQATPLTPSSILRGKLFSALGYVLLLIFAAVPLASLVFIFGGVVLRDMFKIFALLIVLALAFGMLGLFNSALFGRTGRATVASFLVVILLLFVPLLATFIAGVLSQGQNMLAWRWMLVPSPISLLLSVLQPAGSMGGPLDVLSSFAGGWFVQSAIAPVSQDGVPRPLYHYGVPLYLGLTLVWYILATRLLQPARRWRFKRREVIITAAALLGFAALVAGTYLLTAGRYERVKAPQFDPLTQPIIAPAVPVPFGGNVVVQVVEVTVESISEVSPTPFLTPGALVLNEEEQADIYAAVTRHLVSRARVSRDIANLFFITTQPDPGGGQGSSKISDAVINAMGSRLSDLSLQLFWVSEAGGMDASLKGNAVLTFSLIFIQPNNAAQLTASLDFADGARFGGDYLLEMRDGAWQVVGNYGEWGP